MEDTLLAVLDPLPGNPDEYSQGDILLRRVDRKYLGGTFKDLIQKLLDPEADEYNPAYNCAEEKYAELIQSWFDEMERDPAVYVFRLSPNAARIFKSKFLYCPHFAVRIAAIPKNGERPIPVGLDDKISDYTDRILRERTLAGEDGKKLLLHSIELDIWYIVNSF